MFTFMAGFILGGTFGVILMGLLIAAREDE